MLADKVKRELKMLKRHLIILKYVMENEPIGILKIAEETKIPSHKVRYSLRVLEHEGLIAASVPGAISTDLSGPFLEELEDTIGQLQDITEDLKMISTER